MPRTNTQGETISAHDEHEDCPPALLGSAAPSEPCESGPEGLLEVAADLRKLLESAPAHIWLDLGEGLDALTDDATFRNLSEVTWSADNATGCGIKYVRADLAAPTATQSKEPQK